ncbi:hypothetical protein N657DRAFT_682682 [Parathielavia appendiculata]|uniref:Uncharacterized protein n=1 Tax=Parathielavia appendiculata TaxID=2587402 RepID=A0AAN6TVX5_9PEZI|nr:hypothetical protein N657DRAFT_682682 [Parathielavia appendiculata]
MSESAASDESANVAIQPTNPSLYWAGVNGMDPEHWPNVLMVDYIGVQQRDQWAWDRLSAVMEAISMARERSRSTSS